MDKGISFEFEIEDVVAMISDLSGPILAEVKEHYAKLANATYATPRAITSIHGLVAQLGDALDIAKRYKFDKINVGVGVIATYEHHLACVKDEQVREHLRFKRGVVDDN